MIGYLSGTLLSKAPDAVIVDVNGVGYRLEAPLSTLARLGDTGEEVSFHVHTHVREDAIRLYGFDSAEGLLLFEQLIGVSGVGPRMALSALSQMTPEQLRRAIVTSDVSQLSRIVGIGKKTAERIIIDLAELLTKAEPEVGRADRLPSGPPRRSFTELDQALKYLGYKDKEIQSVLNALRIQEPEEVEIETLLKTALKLLK